MAMKVNKYGIICALALLSGVVGCEDSSSLLDKEKQQPTVSDNLQIPC